MANYAISLANAVAAWNRIRTNTATADDLAILAAGRNRINTDHTFAATLAAVATLQASSITTRRTTGQAELDAAKGYLDTLATNVAAYPGYATKGSLGPNLAGPVPLHFGGEAFNTAGSPATNGGTFGNMHPSHTIDFRDEVDGYMYRLWAWFDRTAANGNITLKRRALNSGPFDAWTQIFTSSLNTGTTFPDYRCRYFILPLKMAGSATVYPCLIAFRGVDLTPAYIGYYNGSSFTSWTSSNLANQSSEIVYDTTNKVILCQNASNAASILYADQQVTATDATVHPAYPSTGTNYSSFFGNDATQIARYINFAYYTSGCGANSQAYWTQRLEHLTANRRVRGTAHFYDHANGVYDWHGTVNDSVGCNFFRTNDQMFGRAGNSHCDIWPAQAQVERCPFIARTATNAFTFYRFMFYPRWHQEPYGTIDTDAGGSSQFMAWPTSMMIRMDDAGSEQLVFSAEIPFRVRPRTDAWPASDGIMSFFPVCFDKDLRMLTCRTVQNGTGMNPTGTAMWDESFTV